MIEAQSSMLMYYLVPIILGIGLPLAGLLVFGIRLLHGARKSLVVRPVGLAVLYAALACVVYVLLAVVISHFS